MEIELVPVGHLVYVKINGVLGSKASRNEEIAQNYADRVRNGLARFESLASVAYTRVTTKSLAVD